MDHHGAGFAPWAVLSHHGMAGMDHSGFAGHPAAHGGIPAHHGMAMNLHMSQGFSYYR